ncbi:hypothetical protein, partial [Staphylococcus aureus]
MRSFLVSSDSNVFTSSSHFLCVNFYFDVLDTVSYTHLRAHETLSDLVCRLLLEKRSCASGG